MSLVVAKEHPVEPSLASPMRSRFVQQMTLLADAIDLDIEAILKL